MIVHLARIQHEDTGQIEVVSVHKLMRSADRASSRFVMENWTDVEPIFTQVTQSFEIKD